MPKPVQFKRSIKFGDEPDLPEEGIQGQSEMKIDYGETPTGGQYTDPLKAEERIADFGSQVVEENITGTQGGFGEDELKKLQSVAESGINPATGKKLNKKERTLLNQMLREDAIQAGAIETPKETPSIEGKLQTGVRKATNWEGFTGATSYTESEISRMTNFYTQEKGTIDKYLKETDNLTPEVQKSLAAEYAKLEEAEQIERMKLGKSVEQLETEAIVRKASEFKGLDYTDELIESTSESVGTPKASAWSEDLIGSPKNIYGQRSGKSTSRAAEANMFGQTKVPVRDMGMGDDIWVEGKVPVQKELGKTVTDKFPIADHQIIQRNALEFKLKKQQRELEFLEGLKNKMLDAGVSVPETAAEVKSLKKDIKATQGGLSRLTNVKAGGTPEAPLVTEALAKVEGPEKGFGEGTQGYRPSDVPPSKGTPGVAAEDAIKRAEIEKVGAQQYFINKDIERQKWHDEMVKRGSIPTSVNREKADNKIFANNPVDSPKFKEVYKKVLNELGDAVKPSAESIAKATAVATTVAKQYYKRMPVVALAGLAATQLDDILSKSGLGRKKPEDYTK